MGRRARSDASPTRLPGTPTLILVPSAPKQSCRDARRRAELAALVIRLSSCRDLAGTGASLDGQQSVATPAVTARERGHRQRPAPPPPRPPGTASDGPVGCR